MAAFAFEGIADVDARPAFARTGTAASCNLGVGFLGLRVLVHPLPEDVTGLSTYNIVRQIRCETREAVIGSILRFLTDEANYKGRKVDVNSRNVGLKFAADYSSNALSISKFDPIMLSGFAKTVVE